MTAKKLQKRRSISLSGECFAALRQHCATADVSMAGFVEGLIRKALDLPANDPESYTMAQRRAEARRERDNARAEHSRYLQDLWQGSQRR